MRPVLGYIKIQEKNKVYLGYIFEDTTFIVRPDNTINKPMGHYKKFIPKKRFVLVGICTTSSWGDDDRKIETDYIDLLKACPDFTLQELKDIEIESLIFYGPTTEFVPRRKLI